MTNKKKAIGTLVPMSALWSKVQNESDKGTFAPGMIFLDWLYKTHQNTWQLLPLHETQLEQGESAKRVPSPYKGYGIGLSPRYLSDDFKKTYPTEEEKNEFTNKNEYWLKGYSLFCALSDHFKTDDWRLWGENLRTRRKEDLETWTIKLKDRIDMHIVTQWRLHQSYSLLREKAKSLNISLMGDLPFYISVKSPLVWANQDVFQIEKSGRLKYVSGVTNNPPSFFGRQIWGHPLYKWGDSDQNEIVIKLWEIRLSYLATLFDIIRIDHIKAFYNYGEMHLKNEDDDEYKKGPGTQVLEKLVVFCNRIGLFIFAENSGFQIKEVSKSLDALKITGIKIFRFAFNERKQRIVNEYIKVNKYPRNSISYSTTHDTDTLLGYLQILHPEQKREMSSLSSIPYSSDDREFAKNIINALINSPAATVLIPIQDWLLSTNRINIPGTEKEINDPNWQYILEIPIEDLPTKLPHDKL